MEHRIILGGEQYLPFARSRIKSLKALGLTYANQSFEVDGVSIKVRIEPGHEYIRLESQQEKSDIYLLFLPLKSGESVVSSAWGYRTEIFDDDKAWDLKPNVSLDADTLTPVVLAFNSLTGKIKKADDDLTVKRTTTASESLSSSEAGSTVISGVTYPYTKYHQSSSLNVTSERNIVYSYYGGRAVFQKRTEIKIDSLENDGPTTRDFTPTEKEYYNEQPGDVYSTPGSWGLASETNSSTTLHDLRCGASSIVNGSSIDTGISTYKTYYSSSSIVSDYDKKRPLVQYGYPQSEDGDYQAINRFASTYSTWSSATLRLENNGVYNYQQIKLPSPGKRYKNAVSHDVSLLPVVGSTTNLLISNRPFTREAFDFNYRFVNLNGYPVKSVIPDYVYTGDSVCYATGTRLIRKNKYTGTATSEKLIAMGALCTKLAIVANAAGITSYSPSTYEPSKERTAFYLSSTGATVYPAGVVPVHICATKESIVGARQDVNNSSCFWIHIYPNEPISPQTDRVLPANAKYEGPDMNILRTKLYTNFTGALAEKQADAIVISTPMLPPGYVLAGIKRDEAI